MHPLKSILIEISLYKKLWMVIIIPLCLLPIPIYFPSSKGKCAYVVLWMCSYWTTEALPLAIAGLLPCVVMPLMSIVKIDDIAMEYIKDTSFLFFGGIAMAMSIEKCNLHKRVAISVLRVAGAPARRVVFGFMSTAWLLSMFMNNTATTTMMVPLVKAIILQLKAANEPPTTQDQSRAVQTDATNRKHFPNRSAEDPTSAVSARLTKSDLAVDLVEALSRITHTRSSQVERVMSSSADMENIKRIIEGRSVHRDVADTPVSELTKFEDAPAALPVATEGVAAADEAGHRDSTAVGEADADGASRTSEMTGAIDVRVELKRVNVSPPTQSYNLPSGSSMYMMDTEQTSFEASVSKLSKCLLCGVAYSSTLGGTASLIGTSPNLILKAQITATLGPDVITFTSWLVMALPLSLLAFLLTWLWLVYYFMGKNEFLRIFGVTRGEGFIEVLGEEAIENEFMKLGPLSYAEKNVGMLFILLISLWITRDPGFISGWGTLFKEKYISDTQASLFVTFLLFTLPSKNVFGVYRLNRGKFKNQRKLVKTLMDWKTFSTKMPWDILFLLGGGFALAKGIRASELDVSIAETFESFRFLPPWVLVIVLCLITCMTTEVASNVATASIYLPIVAYLSKSINIDPLYLMVPVCLSSSFSFMLPVGTPPNSIAFTFGDMQVLGMIKVGCVVTLITQILIQIFLNTWIRFVLNIKYYV